MRTIEMVAFVLAMALVVPATVGQPQSPPLDKKQSSDLLHAAEKQFVSYWLSYPRYEEPCTAQHQANPLVGQVCEFRVKHGHADTLLRFQGVAAAAEKMWPVPNTPSFGSVLVGTVDADIGKHYQFKVLMRNIFNAHVDLVADLQSVRDDVRHAKRHPGSLIEDHSYWCDCSLCEQWWVNVAPPRLKKLLEKLGLNWPVGEHQIKHMIDDANEEYGEIVRKFNETADALRHDITILVPRGTKLPHIMPFNYMASVGIVSVQFNNCVDMPTFQLYGRLLKSADLGVVCPVGPRPRRPIPVPQSPPPPPPLEGAGGASDATESDERVECMSVGVTSRGLTIGNCSASDLQLFSIAINATYTTTVPEVSRDLKAGQAVTIPMSIFARFPLEEWRKLNYEIRVVTISTSRGQVTIKPERVSDDRAGVGKSKTGVTPEEPVAVPQGIPPNAQPTDLGIPTPPIAPPKPLGWQVIDWSSFTTPMLVLLGSMAVILIVMICVVVRYHRARRRRIQSWNQPSSR